VFPVTPVSSGRVVSAGINSGVLIIRGSEWSKLLFELWINTAGSDCCFVNGDQVLLHHIVSKNLMPFFYEHSLFVTAASLNMDDARVRLRIATKPLSEFIVHLWGDMKIHMNDVLTDIESQTKPRILE
jgi:galactosyl transferase GMA12/MNN10 family